VPFSSEPGSTNTTGGNGGEDAVGDRLEKPDKSPDEVAALIEKTQDGDDRAYTELREYVGDNPRFWNRIGDLASATEFRWMQMMLGKDKL
jgi:hypothetical protein